MQAFFSHYRLTEPQKSHHNKDFLSVFTFIYEVQQQAPYSCGRSTRNIQRAQKPKKKNASSLKIQVFARGRIFQYKSVADRALTFSFNFIFNEKHYLDYFAFER